MAGAELEIEALWVSVFGEPPPVSGSPGLMVEILVRHLPLAPPYGERVAATDPCEAGEFDEAAA
jgi:hypothetical protein